MRRTRKVVLAALALWALTALPAHAQDTTTDISKLGYDLDVVWVGIAAALVFLMQAGFALVETGLTRAKNAANIMTKNFTDMAVGGVAYWAVGAALAYGASKGGLFGFSGFFFEPGAQGAVLGGDGVQFIFQLVFAATAATIVSGAVAERMKFSGYVIVSLLMTALIYPVVSHWVWGGGWLSARGYHDFAGSSVVHMVGGVASLVGASLLGPRIGKYGKDGKPRAIPGHSIPLALTGVFILWFGWFGFNGGSTLAAQGQGALIGTVLTTTTLAAAAGGLTALLLIWAIAKKPDPAMAGNGTLAGLVAITAGPDLASGGWAILAGVIAGGLVIGAVLFFDRIHVDDPVGAISVHGVAGALGILLVPFYPGAADAGVTLATQALGVVTIAGWVAATSLVTFLAVKATLGLRVSAQEEIDGLDVHEHGVAGYPDFVLGPLGAPRGTASAGAYALDGPATVAPTSRPVPE